MKNKLFKDYLYSGLIGGNSYYTHKVTICFFIRYLFFVYALQVNLFRLSHSHKV